MFSTKYGNSNVDTARFCSVGGAPLLPTGSTVAQRNCL